MSSAPPAPSGSQPGRSAGLTLDLPSNNPFRNRAASPSSGSLNAAPSPTAPSVSSPFDDPQPPQRPVSRNPFLDPNYSSSQPNLVDVGSMSAPQSDAKASLTAEELFDSLTVEDKKPESRAEGRPRPPTKRPPGPPRPQGRENAPPGRRGPPPPGHRLTKSQEEALRAKRMQQGGSRPAPGASPQRRPGPRPRRNSDSSVLEIEDEKKARDARRREKERRAKDGKDPKKPSRKLDIIDQLDATSLFGGGFHHDGPFDAVTSHRNRKGGRRAPMQAFPEDSLNMSMGGSGPLNKNADQATLMGTANDEAFKEYAKGVANNNKNGEAPVFDPRARAPMVYGDESLGLGASTFLEGTPAARTAIQMRQAEQAEQAVASDLQRKKSLANRIRGRNQKGGRVTSPDSAYEARSPDALGPASSSSQPVEREPFFSEHGKESESISVRRPDAQSSVSPPPVMPRRGSDMGVTLERRVTSDGATADDDGSGKPSGGFLSRVKSLKGGRRNRDRQLSDARSPPDPMPPGTAT